VRSVAVVPRREMHTPWEPSRSPEQLCVLYSLGSVAQLSSPIVNESGHRFSTPRWSSRLALDRARVLEELLLETEAEWRLYEALIGRGVKFHLEARGPSSASHGDYRGRAWFVTGRGIRIRFAGGSGFAAQMPGGRDVHYARLDEAVCALIGGLSADAGC
jgi:hypothetical protein